MIINSIIEKKCDAMHWKSYTCLYMCQMRKYAGRRQCNNDVEISMNTHIIRTSLRNDILTIDKIQRRRFH